MAVLMIGALAFGLTRAVRSYLRYRDRGKRVVNCPETQKHPALVPLRSQ